MAFREKILIYVSTLIIIIAASIIFLIYPLKNKITEVKNQISEQKITLEIIKNKSENVTAMQKDYEAILDKKEKVDKMIISSANQLNLFKDIEDLALRNNLTQNYNLDAPAGKNTGELTMNIEIGGEYLKILNYIKGLESLNYYLKIVSINFAVTTAGEPVNATLQAKTYWQ
jgi:Tfp pilus assembly protein PilO